MTRILAIFAVALMAAVLMLAQQQPPLPAPAGGLVNILEPRNGTTLRQDFVLVRYELTQPGAVPGTPTFQLRLDSRESVQTTDTEHTFTGLKPGPHTVTIELVDANERPLPGSRTQVQFRTDLFRQGSAVLPWGGSILPLLALVGFAVLAGGMKSALRRP